MQFRDLKKQYEVLKDEIDKAVELVMTEANYISGRQVAELENLLADYVGVKHCITCANGTDALSLALEAWNIGPGDAVFVPDFTFFASGETVLFEGATPIFVDICEETFNINPDSLQKAIDAVVEEGKLTPRAVVVVDLFGQPADYDKVIDIVRANNMLLLEDGAQGFGGDIRGKRACSFGDIATTSFFPAKPLGCYGDGGAIFTDNDEWADLIKSLRIHGKGKDKYDNVRIGMNSRLDTIQAAILQVKFKAFKEYELSDVNKVAMRYSEKLQGCVRVPYVKEGFLSSWAQYSILLDNKDDRDGLQVFLKDKGIPTMIYYPKGMHRQEAFADIDCVKVDLHISDSVCDRVLALPLHPYMDDATQDVIIEAIKEYKRA
ncbi:MAG: DegT/DnrJ/EryC1/StrS family aminotransferase [Lachnospiraceae bacterium]|nr:DegT/DnrJ/EryC1/StrS family aminotransferase [Lachnospiraceae bacterium]